MTTLNDYWKQTTRFLRDARQEMIVPEDMVSYINRARRLTALRSQCIRRITQSSGSVISASVVAAGSGYTAGATVTISAPDFPSGTGPFPNGDQATATAIIQNGTFAAVDIDYGGY